MRRPLFNHPTRSRRRNRGRFGIPIRSPPCWLLAASQALRSAFGILLSACERSRGRTRRCGGPSPNGRWRAQLPLSSWLRWPEHRTGNRRPHRAARMPPPHSRPPHSRLQRFPFRRHQRPNSRPTTRAHCRSFRLRLRVQASILLWNRLSIPPWFNRPWFNRPWFNRRQSRPQRRWSRHNRPRSIWRTSS